MDPLPLLLLSHLQLLSHLSDLLDLLLLCLQWHQMALH